MSIPSSPIVRRQRLGAELRKLRETHGLKGREVIAALDWRSQSKLSRIEKGESRTDVADIMDLLDLYKVHGTERDKLIGIAREAADRRAHWRTIAGVGDRQRSYAEIEAGATLIRQYQQFLIPGLLQIPEYTRIRVESGQDIQEDIEVDIDSRARELRQGLLTRSNPPHYEAIVEEGALRRAVAPAGVMRKQLKHLLAVTELPNVAVRVLLMDHPVSNFFVPHSSFSIYRFTDPDDPALVVLETMTSDVDIRDQDEIAPYETVYQWIKEASLSEEATRRMIRTLVD